MGSYLEINDTLQLTTEQGFPGEILNLERHRALPIGLAEVQDRLFSFHDKPNARFFHLEPVRVYLVHNIGGKWLFWGRVFIQSQTISKREGADDGWSGEWVTSGTYRIVDLYEPEYQALFTAREAKV